MKRESMNRAIEERFLASLGMTVGIGATFVLLAIVTWVAPSGRAQVTPQRLLDSSKEPQNCLMYSGDYAGRLFSALEQSNTSNAAMLVPKWAYHIVARGIFKMNAPSLGDIYI